MFLFYKGGLGSGNFGHIGRKGIRGGSASMSNTPPERISLGAQRYQAKFNTDNPKQVSAKRDAVIKKDKRAKKYEPILGTENIKSDAPEASDAQKEFLAKLVDKGLVKRDYPKLANDIYWSLNNEMASSFEKDIKNELGIKSRTEGGNNEPAFNYPMLNDSFNNWLLSTPQNIKKDVASKIIDGLKLNSLKRNIFTAFLQSQGVKNTSSKSEIENFLRNFINVEKKEFMDDNGNLINA